MSKFNISDGKEKIRFEQTDEITTLIDDKFTTREADLDLLTVGTIILNGEILQGAGGDGASSSVSLDEITVKKATITEEATIGASGVMTINTATTFNGASTYIGDVTSTAASTFTLGGTNVFSGTNTFSSAATFDNAVTTTNTVTLQQGVTVNNIATLDQVDINNGYIDNTEIGSTTPATIVGTTITANSNFVGNLSGNVSSSGVSTFNSISTGTLQTTGDVTVSNANVNVSGGNLTVNPGTPENPYYIIGNLVGNIQGAVVDSQGNTVIDDAGSLVGDITGNVTGNVTGNLVGNVSGSLLGNVTATEGLSTFYNIQVDNDAEVRNDLLVWGKINLKSDDDSSVLSSSYQIGGNDVLGYGLGADSSNLAVGPGTLVSNTGNTNSVAVGKNALTGSFTGGNNTALGYTAGSSLTTGSNVTTLGYNAQPSSSSATNEVTLGDANVTVLRVPGAGLTVTSGAISATSYSGTGNIATTSGDITTTSGDITASSGTISDSKGDVRRADVVFINSTPYSIPSTASSTTFRCATGASVINLDGNNFDSGDVFIIYNQNATNLTLNFSNFQYVRKPDDGGANYNASSLTLTAYGICTVNCMEEVAGLPRMVISGNV